jgi:hypothetical protein
MKHENNNVQHHEDMKKLTFVVVFLSLFVIALFGLLPLA